MTHLLTLLATTKNHNRGDAKAAQRIGEIYERLKEDVSVEEQKRLVLEALQLKKTPPHEMEVLLCKQKVTHLFCLPYAGGNKRLYEDWGKHLPASVQVHPLEYPGRGTKSKEPLINNLSQLLTDLEQEVLRVGKAPFAIFGHSLGAILAFELGLRLQNVHGITPVCLFLSGSPAPHKTSGLRNLKGQNDPEFISTLQTLGGIPPSLLTTPEFKEFFLPILRNDFSLLDGYTRDLTKVSCPIVLFGSGRDPIASLVDVAAWKEWSHANTVLHEMPGDHFFVHQPQHILSHIASHL